tara:strand:+ start:173 stop:1444 length:1272 start_codon:yes stop_codon:yes gene_type:complete
VELLTNIVAGILGGLILNIMPCVLPVLAFKVQGWVMQSSVSTSDRRKDALAFTAGAVLTFIGFAALVISIRAAGDPLGWGIQMQNSGFVAFLVALLFAFGLNAVGVFEISFSMGAGQSGHGLWGSFSHGALITLVSTPCSAPILGGATAAALAKDASWYETVVLFSSIGFGLSLPVLAVGFIPGAIKLFPKPGNWMNTFKLLVGFTLFGAAVFYYGTLQEQLTTVAANDFLWFLLALSISLWWFEQVRTSQTQGVMRRAKMLLVPLLICSSAYMFLNLDERRSSPIEETETSLTDLSDPTRIKWQLYTEAKHQQATKRQQPILVDFTASWCVNCKAFKKTHLEVDEVKRVLAKTGIRPLTVDLTKDDSLWKLLDKLGRNGIPVYVIYLPDGSFDLLPEGPPLDLTGRLEAAGKKFPKSKFKKL